MIGHLILGSLSISIVFSARLPEDFPKCYLDDANFDDCILKATETLRPFIKKGIAELGILPMDPFTIPSISVDLGTNSVNVKLALENSIIQGLSDYDIDTFNFNPKALDFTVKGRFPALKMDSDYNIDGKILVVPAQGKGKFHGDFEPINVEVVGALELVTIDGEQYMKPKNVKISLTMGKYKYTVDGLFGGNEELTKAILATIDEHQDELTKEITPTIEKVAEELAMNVFEQIGKSLPFNELFPTSS